MHKIVPVILCLSISVAGCADGDRDERLRRAGSNPNLVALMKVADADAGARKFGQCAACHTITKGASDRGGPNLYGIYGQEFGQHRPRYSYTAALRDARGKWDAAALNQWMINPQQLVPGTKMFFAGVADPLDRVDLIAYMKARSD